MHDGKALQAGTSHFFGDGFAKAFDITYTDKENRKVNPFQTSWGVTTRLIGAIIMTHGDDNGLVLPPAVAPTQVVIIPIAQHKEGVLDRCRELADSLKGRFRVKLDDSDNSAGWKFAEYEMKGVPLRLELGPKDMEKNQCVLVRRETREKIFVSLDELETLPAALLRRVERLGIAGDTLFDFDRYDIWEDWEHKDRNGNPALQLHDRETDAVTPLAPGVITDLTTGEKFKTSPFPPFIQNMITNGGLVASIQKGDFC